MFNSCLCFAFGISLLNTGIIVLTFHWQADVIVNTTSTKLDLHQGAVSKSLLKAAGSEMLVECSKKYPHGIKHNEIAITKGYNLKCQNVYHVSLGKYDTSRDHEMYKVCVCVSFLFLNKRYSYWLIFVVCNRVIT